MSRVKRIIVCPDLHVPYHDKLAWATFLNVCREVQPDAAVIIGDFADFYSVSFHSKSPTRVKLLKDEVEQVNLAASALEKLKIPRVIWTGGNHEHRLERYLIDKAPELYGLVSAPDLFKIKERGWEWVPYGDWTKIGSVAFTHEIGRCGKNAAMDSLVDFGGNIVFGHSHRGCVQYLSTVSGDEHVALNVGWLGDYASIDYKHRAMALRQWRHGFGYIEQDTRSGLSTCQFYPILNRNRCVIGGEVIRGRRAA